MREEFGFEEALRRLKLGEKVRRAEWNSDGKHPNFFIFINPPSKIKVQEGKPLSDNLLIGSNVFCFSYIMLCFPDANKENCIMPWVPNQLDILCSTWEVA